jgi:ABC-type multidrug transport system fused ATPase/permease subunit
VEDLRKFALYFRKYKLQLTIGIICIFGSVTAGLFIPLIVGQAVDANWATVSWSKLTISAGKWNTTCDRPSIATSSISRSRSFTNIAPAI